MAGSATTLVDPTVEAFSSSRIIGSPFHSSSLSRKARSEMSKVYDEASALFLTRRIPEALMTIEPLITPSPLPEDDSGEQPSLARAPIAVAKRSLRTKVWVFYLTLLNAIVELGSDKGKAQLGNWKWQEIVTKVEDGSIWDEVVKVGYDGIEENVDADVVKNLANLLLAQSKQQSTTQEHLESYLSKSSYPDLDVRDHLSDSNSFDHHGNSEEHRTHGADTPQKLRARMEIIELFTLHVLPRVGQYDYAREFIKVSDVLDEENMERFLQDLQCMEEEGEKFEDALLPEDVVKDDTHTDIVDRESIDTSRQQLPDVSHHPDSREDFGIDDAHTSNTSSTMQPSPPQPVLKDPRVPTQPTPSRVSKTVGNRKPQKSRADTNTSKRGANVVFAVRNLVSKMTTQLLQNPMGLIQFVLFLLGFLVAISRGDLRRRLSGLTGSGWDRVRQTVGMGVKVSYI